jgi:hypothetical protein
VLVAVLMRRLGPRRALLSAAALIAGTLTTTAGWRLRNLEHFGDPRLVAGQEAVLLARRSAFNTFGGAEIAAGLVQATPYLGDLLAPIVVPTATRRTPGDAQRLYDLGMRRYREAVSVVGADGAFRRLLQSHVLAEPGAFLASSLLLLWRALWAGGGFIALLGALALPRLLRRLGALGELDRFLIAAAPPACLVLTLALLTDRPPLFATPITLVYAVALARVTGGLELINRKPRH